MKSAIIYIALTLFSLSVSLGYSNTLEFIDDIDIWINKSTEEKNWDDAVSSYTSLAYLRASYDSKYYTLKKSRQAMYEMFKLFDYANMNSTDKKLILDYVSNSEDEVESRVFGYIIPKSANWKIMAKVIFKFAEDNPALLTKSPQEFIDLAYKDAWGNN